ncbi:MAG: SPOR domain-containing protein [Terracidiphilus sp.]
MRGIFEDEAVESAEPRRDTELTLGSGMLLGAFFGLVLICGICFGLGYALGAHGSKGAVFQSQPPAAGPATQTPSDSPQGKPSAAAQPPAAPAQQTAANAVPAGGQSAAPGAAAPTPGPAQSPNDGGWHAVQTANPSQVQPALPGSPGTTQSVQQAAVNTVQPAMPSQNSLMVQIAAVSDPEDATVLVGALRKRGYKVSASRKPADNLIHVCVGPFSNSNDANTMRQRLLNDGYNAIVLP